MTVSSTIIKESGEWGISVFRGCILTNLSDSTKPWIFPSESCRFYKLESFFQLKVFRRIQALRCIPFNPGPTRVYSSDWAIHLMTDELTPSGGWNIVYTCYQEAGYLVQYTAFRAPLRCTYSTVYTWDEFLVCQNPTLTAQDAVLTLQKPVLGQRCSTKTSRHSVAVSIGVHQFPKKELP